jgi:hypothetical protein
MEIFIPYESETLQFSIPTPIAFNQTQEHSQLLQTSSGPIEEHNSRTTVHDFFYHIQCPIVKLIDPEFVHHYVRQGTPLLSLQVSAL